jgi:hypothetical protein
VGSHDIQYLPLRVFRSTGEEIHGFAIANVIACIAALDRQHSQLLVEDESEIDPRTGQRKVIAIWKAALKRETLIGHDVVRLLEFPSPIFVSERFADVFQQGRFTGSVFLDPVPVIWDEEKVTKKRCQELFCETVPDTFSGLHHERRLA